MYQYQQEVTTRVSYATTDGLAWSENVTLVKSIFGAPSFVSHFSCQLPVVPVLLILSLLAVTETKETLFEVPILV
jgi:hypothetical protein